MIICWQSHIFYFWKIRWYLWICGTNLDQLWYLRYVFHWFEAIPRLIFFFNNHLKLHISRNSSKLEKWVSLLKRGKKNKFKSHRKYTGSLLRKKNQQLNRKCTNLKTQMKKKTGHSSSTSTQTEYMEKEFFSVQEWKVPSPRKCGSSTLTRSTTLGTKEDLKIGRDFIYSRQVEVLYLYTIKVFKGWERQNIGLIIIFLRSVNEKMMAW